MKQFASLVTKDNKIVTINYDHIVKFYEVGNGEGENEDHTDLHLTLSTGEELVCQGEGNIFYEFFYERVHEDDARLDKIKDSLDGIKSALIETANTLDAMYLNGIG